MRGRRALAVTWPSLVLLPLAGGAVRTEGGAAVEGGPILLSRPAHPEPAGAASLSSPRRPCRTPLRPPPTGPAETRAIVSIGCCGSTSPTPVGTALLWLARHQRPDGRWSDRGLERVCTVWPREGVCADGAASSRSLDDSELTALCLLAFVGAGYSHQSLDAWDGIVFGRVVRNAISFLCADRTSMGPRRALALIEAYRATESPRLQPVARACAARLSATPGNAWEALARESARRTFPVEGSGPPTRSSALRGHAASGLSLLLIQSCRPAPEPEPSLAPDLLERIRGPFDLDAEARLFLTVALYRMDGPGGPLWREWTTDLPTTLACAQGTGGSDCRNGSLAPDGRHPESSRVYATALNILTLEVYYRYASAFGVRR